MSERNIKKFYSLVREVNDSYHPLDNMPLLPELVDKYNCCLETAMDWYTPKQELNRVIKQNQKKLWFKR